MIAEQNKKGLARRNFLKLSGATLAGSVFMPSVLKANTGISPDGKYKLIYRTLGNTGIKLPVVSLGVMRADNPKLVEAALDAGITHLDTAHVYQNGKNEKMLGEVLKDRERDSFVIATKIVPDDRGKDGLIGPGCTKENYLKKLDISLERLKMDYVDILYYHAVSNPEAVGHPPVIEALKEAKKQGKTKHIGISVHGDIAKMIEASLEVGVYDVMLIIINFQMQKDKDAWERLKKAIDKAAEAGVGLIGMKTMAGGYLDKEKTKPVNCKAALKWVLQNPNIHTTIPGMTNYDMLEENMSVMKKLKLSRSEKKDLGLAYSDTGMFCIGCRQCVPTCKKKLEIPDIMRSYMYAYGYGETIKAKELLDRGEVSSLDCTDCDNCTVNCKIGFNIREKVQDISRLRDVPAEFLS